jgi:hypothetical protein
MLKLYCIYAHYRRTGSGVLASARRAFHVWNHGF